MNFFTAQEQARKRTKWLVLWFVMGVVATVLSLYLVVNLLLQWSAVMQGEEMVLSAHPVAIWTAVISAVIIPAGSGFKLMQLSQGGAVVARDMGARQVDPATREFSERQLWNVVEEMSIASGIPMPQVWIMDGEHSINAFAAGTEPGNAVVAVSRGCLKKLTRSELQGVVAHEFSHILNGDMRLNIRLIGWIFGLLMIAMLGRVILSSLRHVRVRGSSDGKGSGGLFLLIIVSGLVLWGLGSLGVLFARIIQAAVSRQREYLADAAAVQFTRDPSGIAGALKKIARGTQQKVLAPHAAETAHMMFDGPVGFFLPGLLATHPPLIKRILAIDPRWDGDLRKSDGDEEMGTRSTSAPVNAAALVSPFSAMNLTEASTMRQKMASSGSIVTVAEAKAVIFSLVAGNGRALAMQPATELSEEEKAAFDRWWLLTRGMNSAQKIAWMDLAIPVLRQMTPEEYRRFRADLQVWTMSDGQVSIFEWMLHHALNRHLLGAFERVDVVSVRWHEIAQVEQAVAVLLACLCQPSQQAAAWSRCAEEYYHRFGRALPSVSADFHQLQEALSMLEQASAALKGQILDLCRWVTLLDGTACNQETEILRATADAIGVAVPLRGMGSSRDA